MLDEIEGWGIPRDFILKSFRTFPYNHAASSYAILDHRNVIRRECVVNSCADMHVFALYKITD